MPAANWSASACVAAVTSVRLATGTGAPVNRRPHPSGVNQPCTGSSAAPVERGQPRRAGRHPGGLAEELDQHAVPARSRSATRATDAAVAQPPAQRPERCGTALIGGEHLEAKRPPVGEEPFEQGLRPEPFGDCRHRRGPTSAQVLDQPDARDVPVARCAATPGSTPRPAASASSRWCSAATPGCRSYTSAGSIAGSRNASHQYRA